MLGYTALYCIYYTTLMTYIVVVSKTLLVPLLFLAPYIKISQFKLSFYGKIVVWHRIACMKLHLFSGVSCKNTPVKRLRYKVL